MLTNVLGSYSLIYAVDGSFISVQKLLARLCTNLQL